MSTPFIFSKKSKTPLDKTAVVCYNTSSEVRIMELEKARNIARAVDNLDSFLALAEQIESAVQEWDNGFASSEFVHKLMSLLDEEEERRRKIIKEFE